MTTKNSNKPTQNLVEERKPSALHKFLVLDSQFEILYDSITNLAAKICEVPVALITFVDDERVWFKSEVGYSNVTDIPRRDLFCGIGG